MKINFPRHTVYTISFTIFLIIFAVWFAVGVLIPKGKDYRKNRTILLKEKADLQKYDDFYKKTLSIYNKKKSKNRYIIEALQDKFDPQRFVKEYQKHFIALSLSKVQYSGKTDIYDIYEVNTTSKIKSPTNFYNFLDAINKSQWLIEITFPINFTREGELIYSSFKMHVYKKSKDTNKTITKKEETPPS